jgi:hypothetical protein
VISNAEDMNNIKKLQKQIEAAKFRLYVYATDELCGMKTENGIVQHRCMTSGC